MDATFLRKTFALIAKGLVEKEQLLQKEPTRYPYSKALQHGINMFLAASHQIGGIQDISNRQRSRRIDFHEIIVLERCGTFQHYFVWGVLP